MCKEDCKNALKNVIAGAERMRALQKQINNCKNAFNVWQ